MSIRNLLRGGGPEIERFADEDLDFDPGKVVKFAIRRYSPGESGAQGVAGFDDLDEPIKKAHFVETVENEGLPYGTYKLLALGGERNQIIGTIWSLEDVGSRAALDQQSTVDEELAALREQLRDHDREPRIEEPGDAFGVIAEEIVAGDLDLGEKQIEQLRDFLNDWEKANREPSVDLLAYELAHGFLQADSPEMAVRILDKWLRAEGSGSDLDLVELASDGDLSDLSDVDVKSLAMLRVLDDPGGVAREVSTGLLEAAGEHREAGVEVDLGEE